MRFETMPSRSITAGMPKDGGPISGDRLAELDAVAHRLGLRDSSFDSASCALPEAQRARPARPPP